MGFIISIVNNKGGVGKTSISCNLGAALARRKKQVLIIDADPQCNATGMLLPGGNREYTLYELLDMESDNKIDPEQCVYPSHHQTGLYCIPNVRATSGLDMGLVAHYPRSLLILREKVMEFAMQNYDYTLIDTPPNIGMFTAISLHTSHAVIIPIDASSSDSMDGLQEALALIDSIRNTYNPDLRFLRLLINRVHGQKTICKVIVADIKKRFRPDQIFQEIIPENTALQQSAYSRETIFKFNQSSNSARAFRRVANELTKIIEG